LQHRNPVKRRNKQFLLRCEIVSCRESGWGRYCCKSPKLPGDGAGVAQWMPSAFGGFEIDDQLHLRQLLNRQIGRLVAFENSAEIAFASRCSDTKCVMARLTRSSARPSSDGGKVIPNALAVFWLRASRVCWPTSPVVRLRYSIIDQAAVFTLVNCGVALNAIAARFQALIATTAAVRSTSSFSEKCRRASS
jgi:hypothetical protein